MKLPEINKEQFGYNLGAGVIASACISTYNVSTYLTSAVNAIAQSILEKIDMSFLPNKTTKKIAICSTTYVSAFLFFYLLGVSVPNMAVPFAQTFLADKIPSVETLKNTDWKALAAKTIKTVKESDTQKTILYAAAATLGILVTSSIVSSASWQSPFAALLSPIAATLIKMNVVGQKAIALTSKFTLSPTMFKFAVPVAATFAWSVVSGFKLSTIVSFVALTSLLTVADEAHTRWNEKKDSPQSTNNESNEQTSSFKLRKRHVQPVNTVDPSTLTKKEEKELRSKLKGALEHLDKMKMEKEVLEGMLRESRNVVKQVHSRSTSGRTSPAAQPLESPPIGSTSNGNQTTTKRRLSKSTSFDE